uniref:(northern house mosquito) hypothetical protein n=1 Tax=Culex pipiens TaxID=7175 RepID=A0A8D8CZ74_CULPI
MSALSGQLPHRQPQKVHHLQVQHSDASVLRGDHVQGAHDHAPGPLHPDGRRVHLHVEEGCPHAVLLPDPDARDEVGGAAGGATAAVAEPFRRTRASRVGHHQGGGRHRLQRQRSR